MIRYRKSMRDALGEVRGLVEDATTSYPPKEINKKKHDAYKDPKKGEKEIQEEDPSIDDIAKGLKLDKKLVKKIMGEEINDLQEIPASLMQDLRKTFEPLRGKKISVDNSNKLSAIMNKFTSKADLITLFKADIPFISLLASTRLIQKFGMSGAQINKLREEVELDEMFDYAIIDGDNKILGLYKGQDGKKHAQMNLKGAERQLGIKKPLKVRPVSKKKDGDTVIGIGEEVELKEFSSQQIKQAYGIANDPRYKQGNMSGAVNAIEKIAKGLSKHPDVQKVLKRTQEEVELDETLLEFKKGDIVIPNVGPHKGVKHEIIHDFKDGTYNIQPDIALARNIKYRLGAARAKASELVGVDEETVPANVKKIAKELDKAVAMHKSQAQRLRKAGVSEEDKLDEMGSIKPRHYDVEVTIKNRRDAKAVDEYISDNMSMGIEDYDNDGIMTASGYTEGTVNFHGDDAGHIGVELQKKFGSKIKVVGEQVEIKEEVADIFVQNKVGSEHQVQIALTIKALANKLGLRNGSVGPVVRVMGPKNVVNQFLGSVIGKSSMGNATQKGTIPKDYDKSLNKQLREETLELGEGTMKGGLITDRVDDILKIGPKFVALISRKPTVQQLERMCVQELFDDSLLDDFYYIDPSSKGIVKSGNPEAKKAYGKHARVLHSVDPRSVLQYNLAGRTFQGRSDGLMLHSLGAAMLAFHLADLGIPAIKINPDLEVFDNPKYKGTQKISPDVILKNFRVSKSDVLRVIQMHMRDMSGPEISKLVSISPKSLQYQFKENSQHAGARGLVERLTGMDLTEVNADVTKSLTKKSKASGIPLGILKQVFKRGMAAFGSGSRTNMSQHGWSHARVNSFIAKKPGTWGGADKDLAKQARSSK